ncbi:MAG: rhamnan synthesis F family protein [Verrucomicrobiota bacterium]
MERLLGKPDETAPVSSAAAKFAKLADCAAQFAKLDRSKKTILLVTHEMSRSGAPILLLNIAKALRTPWNVLILTLKSGGLEYAFTAGSDVLIGNAIPREHMRCERFLTQLFRNIASHHPIHFAIVNSIVSNSVLKPLWENDIPSIHLIHEFASCNPPYSRYRHSAVYSSLQIFPAELVRKDAILASHEIQIGQSLVLPQGKSDAPGNTGRPEQVAAEKERIRDTFRPVGFPKETVVIVGMGKVEIRKGVDLFVATAKRVAELQPETPFRFVWIGRGYDPEKDLGYSVYLADQIKRSGLKERFTMMDAVAEIEEAYQQSDILFLSSRLDPLPLVSQDSMAHGKPVVCFENTTGIAEYLEEDPDAACGIIPYLDVEQAAQRIRRLIDDGERRKQVGEGCRRLIAKRFDFGKYVERLHCLGMEEATKKATEKADRTLIQQSPLVVPNFIFPASETTKAKITEDVLRRYTSAWRTGIETHKPFPGFHPGIYAECNNLKNRDPFAHYIEAGQPTGPWRYELIEAGKPATPSKAVKVGLHLHLYFPDVAAKIFERFQAVQTPMDLLISVPTKEFARKIEASTMSYARGRVDIRVVPNRGRDIGPFLTEFGKEILANYDIIGHIHTKKSLDFKGSKACIENWAAFLYENLLGGKAPMADNIIGRMTSDETLGLVFPDDPNAIGWEKNWASAVALAERLNIAPSSLNKSFNFPVGTMFWARPAALRPLLELGLQWEDYPPEPLPYDGSMLHALERMLPFIVKHAGFRSAATYVAGVTR